MPGDKRDSALANSDTPSGAILASRHYFRMSQMTALDREKTSLL
jgi:hypothetical protein